MDCRLKGRNRGSRKTSLWTLELFSGRYVREFCRAVIQAAEVESMKITVKAWRKVEGGIV